MVNYVLQDLFYRQNVDKQFIITTDDGKVTITNTELHQENFELTESLCSESELTFGACEAAAVKFTISNVFTSLKDKWITIKIILDGNSDNPFILGRYKVVSDKPTADRIKREIEAYDALYDVINADVARWYNTLLPNDDSTTTMKVLRDSFFEFFGITQKEITLVNDNMSVEKTVEVESLSGGQILNAICEINGCMGHIGRGGPFEYVYPATVSEEESGYPSSTSYPSLSRYPGASTSSGEADVILDKNKYISAEYEDYDVANITGVQIRQEEDDAGVVAGTSDNVYIIENNCLAYGKGSAELTTIANNILSKINNAKYKPYTASVAGNPCIEVGDTIKITTKYADVNSFVMQRTLKGIQAIRDSFTAEGEQFRTAKINGTKAEINQLRERSNILKRDVDETRSTVRATMVTWDTGDYSPNHKGYGVPSESNPTHAKDGDYYLDIETGYIYYLGETWEKVYECSRAKTILESQIIQTAERISSKVSKDDIISEINQTAETIKIKANKIELDGMVVANATLSAATLSSPQILGKTAHAEAISIGEGEKYNNVVMNEEGTWVIGNGEAEAPVVRIENDGRMTIMPETINFDKKFFCIKDRLTGDEYGITADGVADFRSVETNNIQTSSLKVANGLYDTEINAKAVIMRGYDASKNLIGSKSVLSANISDNLYTVSLDVHNVKTTAIETSSIQLAQSQNQLIIKPNDNSNYYQVVFRENTTEKVYDEYCTIDKFKTVYGITNYNNGTVSRKGNYITISNTTGTLTANDTDGKVKAAVSAKGLKVNYDGGGSIQFAPNGIEYKKDTISSPIIIKWDTFIAKLGG